MITIIQTLAGATQFSGIATRGLVRFEDFLSLPDNDLDVTPIIVHIGLKGDNIDRMNIDCFLQRQGGTTTERLQILLLTAQLGFTKLGCRIPVPRDSATFVPWELQLITAQKAVDASFVVSFEAGSAVSGDL